MMPDTTQTVPLQALKLWALQHHRNEIERAILFYAPDHFDWDDCDCFEERRLNEFKVVIVNLTPALLRSPRYMNSMIDDKIGDAVNLLKRSRRPRK